MTTMGIRTLLLLLALVQADNAPQSIVSPVNKSDDVRQPATEPTVRMKTVPLSEVRDRVTRGEFVPVPRERLKELTNVTSDPEEIGNEIDRPGVREAKYSAQFLGTRLEGGSVQFQLYDDAQADNSKPLVLGATNLQNLRIEDVQGFVPLGADFSQRLFLLKSVMSSTLTGSFSADGQVAGDVVTFVLSLPEATTSSLLLRTSPEIQVTSAGSLVIGPTPSGEQAAWTLIPGDPSRFRFSCRRKPGLASQSPMPLASCTSTHSLTADLLTSRWTLLLPVSAEAGTILTSRISRFARVTDVSLDDQRPVQWSERQENGQAFLTLTLPESSASASLTVTATSILPQKESWDLPMLSPLQWSSSDGSRRGPVLVPIGQMNVLLPAAVELDEWILVGIQERDVVTRPDQSREYQLVQFLPEASAAVRTSTSLPRLTDTVVALLEPAGRLATARCFVNVQCDSSSIVELKWPVAAGWQVISARQLSDNKALFFEFREPAPEQTSSELTIHLPVSLESGASRQFELQFQQTDSADFRTLQPPIQKSPQVDRNAGIVVFPAQFPLSGDLQRRWSDGRPPIAIDDLKQRYAWLPQSRLAADMRAYDVTAAGPGNVPTPSDASEIRPSPQLTYAAEINSGLLLESTQIELPPERADLTNSFLISSDVVGDCRWTVDGEQVAARRDPEQSDGATWHRWIMPPGTIRSGRAMVVRCESRRPAPRDLKEFTAAVVYPDLETPFQGVVQLTETDSGILSTAQLLNSPRNQSQNVKTTSWILPTQRTAIRLQVARTPRIQQGQTIDVQMLHLIEERTGSLHHEILAVATVSRLSGRSHLQLSIPASLRPLVLVDGHHVQLTENKDGLFVPLPAESSEAQILLCWTVPETRTVSLTGARQLPRLFHNELAEPQSTHHLLIDPLLEISAPMCNFASSEKTDVLATLSRVPGALSDVLLSGNGNAEDQFSQTPSEVRSFVTRWQLAASRNWSSKTLIDAAASEKPIEIEITRIRRRLAIFSGTFLVFIGASVVFRSILNHYRLSFAIGTIVLFGISFLAETQLQTAILRGSFWGLSGGLFLVFLSRWNTLRGFLKTYWMPNLRMLLRVILITLVLPCTSDDAMAFQQPSTGSSPQASVIPGPASASSTVASQNASKIDVAEDVDVLVPDVSMSDIVYIRRELIDNYRSRQTGRLNQQPAALLTKMHAVVRAENSATIEILLELHVAVPSSQSDAHLQLPLHGALLERCTVDDREISPQLSDDDSIRIVLPRPMVMTPKELSSSVAWKSESSADEPNSAALPTTESPAAQFDRYVIQCRLRPLTIQQQSGLQFQMPALPCPETSIEIDAARDLFSGVRAKTASSTMQWIPQDGPKSLNSLSVTDGIEVRLFQSSIERGSPQSATVETLAIGETVSGQYQLTSIARFRNWNPLSPDVRFRIPNGYELLSVSASVGPDMADLLWSVNDQNVIIQLPDGIGSDFLLALQLKSTTPATLLEQPVPIAELQQFADCTASSSLLLAVRPNPVFSVLPIEGQQIVTVSFPELQTAWGQWLRRSDTVFRIPLSNAVCNVRLVPRESRNEVRIDQAVTVRENQIDWSSRFDIDTTVLPVFRHRLQIDATIIVSDVQVLAGEANRLASWHRRGDQLTIQLREGTTGQHQITIKGRQPLRPDDVMLTLNPPRLQKAQILESALTLLDNDGLGLTFEKLGGAVPDFRIEDGAVLLPETAVRLQIVSEQEPVVLKRLRPVEPEGTIVAVRSKDEVTFIARVTRWSGTLGPLHLKFDTDMKFIAEPFVMLDAQKMPLTREGNEFSAGQEIVKSLFDQPEFIVSWTVPYSTESATDVIAFPWPSIIDGIQWKDLQMIPLDSDPGSSEEQSSSTQIADWIRSAVNRAASRDLAALKARIMPLAVSRQLVSNSLTLPIRRAPDVPVPETTRNLMVVADSTVCVQPNQSAVGDTLFVIFASRFPERCSIRIPPGTVVTELESQAPARWQTTGREQFTVDVSAPVTTVRARWMSERASGSMTTASVDASPPYPFECESRQQMAVFNSSRNEVSFASKVSKLSEAEYLDGLTRGLEIGSNHANTEQSSAASAAAKPAGMDRETILRIIEATRTNLLDSISVSSSDSFSRIYCQFEEPGPIQIISNREADWKTVIGLFAGTGIILIAAFGQLLNSLFYRSFMKPPIATASNSTNSKTAPTQQASSNTIGSSISLLPDNPSASNRSSSEATKTTP